MSRTEWAELDGVAQAALVKSGEVSPRELVDAAIERIERLNPQLGAVIHPTFERARAEADAGPVGCRRDPGQRALGLAIGVERAQLEMGAGHYRQRAPRSTHDIDAMNGLLAKVAALLEVQDGIPQSVLMG